MIKLGVNIDHVATLRQARRGPEPSPCEAARICERAGAHSIVAHLREDRRHIQDEDVRLLRRIIRTRFNLEMSIHPAIVAMACRIKPDQATLVPEKRQEITTEGGLNVCTHATKIGRAIKHLHACGIRVSLFIAPDKEHIRRSQEINADCIELHTGFYANAKTARQRHQELQRIHQAVQYAHSLGLIVHAGHGLNYDNTRAIAQMKGIEELNIGHAIMARAMFTGLAHATRQMLAIMKGL